MQAASIERRQHRSNVPATALECLLQAQVTRGSLASAVIASDEGLLVAAVGHDADMIAAVAPAIASGHSACGFEGAFRDVSVHSFSIGSERLHIALRGGDRAQHLALAALGAQGAQRILRS